MSAAKKTKAPKATRRTFFVTGHVTITVHTEIKATTAEEAIELASSERAVMSLCHQCSEGDPSSEWVTSGDLDGSVENVSAEET